MSSILSFFAFLGGIFFMLLSVFPGVIICFVLSILLALSGIENRLIEINKALKKPTIEDLKNLEPYPTSTKPTEPPRLFNAFRKPDEKKPMVDTLPRHF